MHPFALNDSYFCVVGQSKSMKIVKRRWLSLSQIETCFTPISSGFRFMEKINTNIFFRFVLRIWPFDCSFLLINSIQKERPVRFSKPCINLMNFRDFFLLKIGKCFQLGAVIEKAKIDHLTRKWYVPLRYFWICRVVSMIWSMYRWENILKLTLLGKWMNEMLVSFLHLNGI